MAVTRRQFLAAPVALGGVAASGALLSALAAETAPLPDLTNWANVRAQFALDPELLHFASFFIASHPTPVRNAIETWRRRMESNPLHVIEQGMFEEEAHNIPLQVQQVVAGYI